MSESCDHEFGGGTPSDFSDGTGLSHDSGLPMQVDTLVPCKKCGKRVPVDYNLAFIDGDTA